MLYNPYKMKEDINKEKTLKTINNISVEVIGFNDMTDEEIKKYIKHIQTTTNERFSFLRISPDSNNNVVLDFNVVPPKFERIRRITGYLVGTTDRWNNAKRAEEHDRVKHGLTI